MKNVINFLTLLLCITILSCSSQSQQRAAQSIKKIETVNKSAKIVLLKEIERSLNNTFGEKVYRCKMIPYDSITHFVKVSRLYEVKDTLKLSDAIMFK